MLLRKRPEVLKTEYLGWSLDIVERMERNIWHADYSLRTPEGLDVFTGTGHSPESACADAQKKIKNVLHSH